MPSTRRQASPRRPIAVVVTAIVAIGLASLLVWSAVRFAAQNPDKANLGSNVFNVGNAQRLSREIDERGPFLFQDPLSLGRGRNLYIQHLGDDPETGWSAIEARRADDGTCAVTWSLDREVFVDCRGERHPPDGTGLVVYPGTVEDGQVRVDLRSTSRPGAGPTPPAG